MTGCEPAASKYEIFGAIAPRSANEKLAIQLQTFRQGILLPEFVDWVSVVQYDDYMGRSLVDAPRPPENRAVLTVQSRIQNQPDSPPFGGNEWPHGIRAGFENSGQSRLPLLLPATTPPGVASTIPLPK